MKVIICGSSSINDYSLLLSTIEESHFNITNIISGNNFGVDRLGERYAKEHNISLSVYRRVFNRQKSMALSGLPNSGLIGGGLSNVERDEIRIKTMVEEADAVIAIYDGYSLETTMIMQRAEACNLPIYIKIV